MSSALTPPPTRSNSSVALWLRTKSIAASKKSMPSAALSSSGGCQPLWVNMALSSEMLMMSASTQPAKANQPPQKTSATTMGMSTSAESERWASAANQVVRAAGVVEAVEAVRGRSAPAACDSAACAGISEALSAIASLALQRPYSMGV